MTNLELSRSYLQKCRVRLKALALLRDERAWSDVMREAQEIVELALKGVLRAIGSEAPKLHDVSPQLLAQRGRLPPGIDVDRLAAVSVYLRKHGEMAFYGAEDLIPTTAYDQDEASRAFTGAEEATQALVLVLAAAGG